MTPSLDELRYRWLREHPAFESEAALAGLAPEEFDALVDQRMRDDVNRYVWDIPHD